MLRQRVATAAIGLPLLLGLLWLGGAWWTVGIAAVLAVGMLETLHLGGVPLRSAEGAVVVLTAVILGVNAHVGRSTWLAAFVLVPVAGATWTVWRSAELRSAVRRWAVALVALAYVGVLGSAFLLLRRLPDGRDWTLLAFAITFAADTGAYFTGRTLGRHPMAGRISPKKTVEGALGGLASAALVGALIGPWAATGIPWWQGALLALVATFASQAGDLAESAAKRAVGVKDSGRLLPGHGGVLDRIDSLLLAGPVVYLYVGWVRL